MGLWQHCPWSGVPRKFRRNLRADPRVSNHPMTSPAPLLCRLLLASPLACASASRPTAAECPAPAAAGAATTGAATTVLVVRHGEKAADDPADPSLSPAGETRARALATTLVGAGVTHCFATEFRRTQATLAPLCSGREVVVVPASDTAKLVARIRGLPAGSVVAVAGHSNTVPAIVAALASRDGAAATNLADDSYDRLFVVRVDAGPPLELRYGPQ